MATKIEFMDGFDGWEGMGAYTSGGTDNTHSPWILRDRSGDLTFGPGATDYAGMVNLTAGEFGGGALKIPQAQTTEMMPRLTSAQTLSFMPIDNYVLNGETVVPVVPHVVTFGYYFKTAANGFNNTRRCCGMELMEWEMHGHQEQNGILSGTREYAKFSIIKRPDDTLWGGWMRRSEEHTS